MWCGAPTVHPSCAIAPPVAARPPPPPPPHLTPDDTCDSPGVAMERLKAGPLPVVEGEGGSTGPGVPAWERSGASPTGARASPAAWRAAAAAASVRARGWAIGGVACGGPARSAVQWGRHEARRGRARRALRGPRQQRQGGPPGGLQGRRTRARAQRDRERLPEVGRWRDRPGKLQAVRKPARAPGRWGQGRVGLDCWAAARAGLQRAATAAALLQARTSLGRCCPAAGGRILAR
jgi:hypothetical protein